MNHLSDSISIVDVTTPGERARRPHAARRRRAARPRASPDRAATRAFVTTAHRGQNTPLHATIATVLSTPGIGRADVWVFDATNLGATLGGTPETIVTLFGDTPRRARGQPRRHPRLRRRLPLRQPDDRRSPRASCRTAARGARAARLQRRSRRPARAEHELREHPGTRGRPDRQVRRHALARRARALLGRGGQASRSPTRTCSRSTRRRQSAGAGRRPERVRQRRRHDPLQHGREPGERQRSTSRTSTRSIDVRFEGAGSVRGGLQAARVSRRSVRGHFAESRITVLDGGAPQAAPSEQARRLLDLLRADPERRERHQHRRSRSAWRSRATARTLYVAGFGSSEVGVYGTTPARERHVRAERARSARR